MNPFCSIRIVLKTRFRELLVLAVLFYCSCEGPRVGTAPEPPPAHTSNALAAGDVLKITFPGTPELNASAKIRLDGKVSLPLIGEVDAAGKRLEAFQSELATQYAPQLQNKEVIVGLEAGAASVYVSGAVNHPGKIMLDRPMTAIEAIMEAGGINDFGSLRKVHLVRLTDGTHRTEYLDLSQIVSGRSTKAFYLKAGDMIYIP